MNEQITSFKKFLFGLQSKITSQLSMVDGGTFISDEWEKNINDGAVNGIGNTMVLKNGNLIEQGGVNVSSVRGDRLPVGASDDRGHLAGLPFEAMGLSLVIHPVNPHVPTTHANIRLILVKDKLNPDKIVDWWFGGGFDLTPFYVYEEDIIHWHTSAQSACSKFGKDLYPRFKRWCDDYFYLPHRKETRGVGGIFFDDFNELPFDQCLGFTQSVGEAFLSAYVPIIQKRSGIAFTQAEREFQAYRRGRYVEFNLVYDRGTFFGLKSGFRIESILMSLPPHVRFEYDYKPEGTREQSLSEYLKPRDWLNEIDCGNQNKE